jgi:lipooligosaccharide transport system permease protein
VATAVAAYLVVMAAFGAIASPAAIFVLPVGVLTGMAFATPLAAFSASQENEEAFPLVFRLGVIPLFLFSGVFFPISQLPVGLRIVAYVTPLWHGVNLCRSLTLGQVDAAVATVNVVYLTALTAIGVFAASRSFRGRLRT